MRWLCVYLNLLCPRLDEHVEHAGDPADGPGLERVLLLAAPVRFLTLEVGGQSSSGDPFAGVSIDQAS